MPKANTRDLLRTLRSGAADAPPLFFVHPSGGLSSIYQNVADSLSWPGPIIGIDARTPPIERPSETALRDMAGDYADLICAAEFPRPFRVFGWTIGGNIAAELAVHLIERSEPVAFLGVLEAVVPKPEFVLARPSDTDTLTRAYAETMTYIAETRLEEELPDTSPETVATALRAVGAIPADWGAREVAERLSVFLVIARGFLKFSPRRITVPLHLFEVTKRNVNHPTRPDDLGWGEHADELHKVEVPGDHYNMINREHAPELARIIDGCLERAPVA
jgi:thioesterase domain-containing protein